MPNNEKKKYEYTPSKPEKSTTPAPDEEAYLEEYDYESEKMIQPDAIDIKKGNYNQREQRPAVTPSAPLPPHRTDVKDDKLLPYDEIDDEELDARNKAPPKPQRATPSNDAKPIQQQQQQKQQHHHQQQQIAPPPQPQRPSKVEYYDTNSKEIVAKNNPKPIDFNKDEYIPDSESVEYPEEEIDDRTEVAQQHQVIA